MLKRAVEFLFEAGMLKRTPRTGYQFLGTGGESVADHCFRTAMIGYVLGSHSPDVDRNKIILMCLVHDLPEARTGDHNYVNKRYVEVDEEEALSDQVRDLPFGDEIIALSREFNAGETQESRIAKDADQLDLMLELKEQLDLGNESAGEWLGFAEERLHTETAKEMAREMLTTKRDSWWFDRRSDWWINGPENR